MNLPTLKVYLGRYLLEPTSLGLNPADFQYLQIRIKSLISHRLLLNMVSNKCQVPLIAFFFIRDMVLMKICVWRSKAVGDAGYPTIHDKIKKHLHSSAKSSFAFDRAVAPLIPTTISKNHEQAFMMKCEVKGRLDPEGNTRKTHTTWETFAVIIYLVGLVWIWKSGVVKPWTRGPSTKFEPIHSFDQWRWDEVLHILPRPHPWPSLGLVADTNLRSYPQMT
jgi:hypothetical protein